MHRDLSKYPFRGSCPESYQGKAFSLLELVVVIAILAILVAIALPNFIRVRQDGQISQSKNALATILKECVVAQLRGIDGGNPRLSAIPSSRASLSGYKLAVEDSSGTLVYSSDARYGSLRCFQVPVGYTNSQFIMRAEPTILTSRGNGAFPSFQINFDPSTASTTKNCTYFSPDREVYSEGCIPSFRPPPGYSGPLFGEWD